MKTKIFLTLGCALFATLALAQTQPPTGQKTLAATMNVFAFPAKGQDTDREAALAGGADDFLTKPFSPKKLVARIREILSDG